LIDGYLHAIEHAVQAGAVSEAVTLAADPVGASTSVAIKTAGAIEGRCRFGKPAPCPQVICLTSRLNA
jgi:hypothetical protein